MRIAVSIVGGLFAVYTGISALVIAHIGVSLQVTQLEAAGASELFTTLACGLGAALVFWRRWAAFTAFGVASLWCVFIAVDFLDETTWLWFGSTVILSIWSLYTKRRLVPSLG